MNPRRLNVLLILCSFMAPAACERTRAPGETTGRPEAEKAKEAGEVKKEEPGATREAKPAAGEVATGEVATTGVGTLSGRVIFRGSLPDSTTMFVPEAGDLEAHTTIVDARTRGLKNAVVWVEGAPPGIPVTSLPTVVLDQKDWTFLPHVLAVRAGQTVRFVNSDIANHNVHSLTSGNTFNLGFVSGTDITHRFRKPTGTRPVRLDCDIHHWMRAWVYVFRQDAFAVTDAQGRFRIEGVPSGRQRLRVHHADGELEAAREVVIETDGETRLDLEVGGASPVVGEK